MTADWRTQFETLVQPAVARSATIGEIVVEAGALGQAGAVHRRAHGDEPALLIADENTFTAAGAAVESTMRNAGIAVARHILPADPRPKPTVELAETLRQAIASSGARPVAVGSGVINDLVKYAAHRQNLPYSCVATAASMDGYASAGSPLSQDGFKMTIACTPPATILADLDVMTAAPKEMTGWGYGDLAGKNPAGADWILADALDVEPIDPAVWPLVQAHLGSWLDDAEAIAAGEPGAFAQLFMGLTMAGLAMEAYGGSRPASGADHQIAHLWEMEGLTHRGERVSHGACVAVGTLTVLGLYDWVLAQDLTRLDHERILAQAATAEDKRAAIAATFTTPAIAERATAETLAKHLEPDAHRDRLAKIAQVWPDLQTRLRGHLIGREEMAALLAKAGAPTRAAEIGVDPTRHRATVAAARFQRSRYTIFDLLEETGLLTRALDSLFSQPSFQAA